MQAEILILQGDNFLLIDCLKKGHNHLFEQLPLMLRNVDRLGEAYIDFGIKVFQL